MTEPGSASSDPIPTEERSKAWAVRLLGRGAKVVEQVAGQEQVLIGQQGLSEFGHSGQSSHSPLWGPRPEALTTTMVASAVIATVSAILRPLSVAMITVAKISMARNRTIRLFPRRPEPEAITPPRSYQFARRKPIRGRARRD